MSLYKITVCLPASKLGCIHPFKSTSDALAAMNTQYPAARVVAVINLGRA